MGKRRPGMTEEEIAKARRRSRRCYWRNRDQILERERQCRKDNAAQIRKRTREYYWANRERILDRARGYRDGTNTPATPSGLNADARGSTGTSLQAGSVRKVAFVGDLPFVVGFDEHGAGQPLQRGGVGEDSDDVGTTLISLLSRSSE